MKKLGFVILALAVSAPARADMAAYPIELTAKWVKSRRDSLAADADPKLVAGCEQAVAELKKAGATTVKGDAIFNEFGGGGGTYDVPITLAQATAICAEGAHYNVLLADYHVFTELIDSMRYLRTDMMPSAEYVAGVLKSAGACTKAVDALLAANVPGTERYEVKGEVAGGGTKVFATTVADLKPNICDAAKKAAAQFTKAAGDLAAAARAKLTKFGIEGDRLSLMLRYDGSLFLAGGGASSDLKKYAAASTLFVWLTSSPDIHDMVVHTVRRYQFKGNQLVSQTEKTYRRPRGAKLGAAPFK